MIEEEEKLLIRKPVAQVRPTEPTFTSTTSYIPSQRAVMAQPGSKNLPKPVVADMSLEKAKIENAKTVTSERTKEAKLASGFGPYTNILRCQTTAFDWF